jgi:acetylornithine/N-succinyldiaminopimelate aminotransferase
MIDASNVSILNSYKRFPIVLRHGQGSVVYDEDGKDYLDFGAGIAVNSLGHNHPKIVRAISEQASKIIHVSNLYFTRAQLDLADKLISLIAPGKIYYSNSGAEANECLIKLARSYGSKEGRFEIITTDNSFHGRTMAGISATGQEKVKKSFYPLLPGFKHVAYNDANALEFAISKDTVAVMIEGVQGEGGIIPATPEYLLKIRKICDKHNLLLFIDSIQCGFYRTGNFLSYNTILGKTDFLPDGISMAKGLGAGLPIGASWIADKFTSYLPQGSHGSTFGGNPLVTQTALTAINLIENEGILENIKTQGNFLKSSLNSLLEKFPKQVKAVRGLGLMLGIEFNDIDKPTDMADLTNAGYLSYLAMKEGLLLVPAGSNTLRFVPSYIVTREECEKAISILEALINKLDN